jgi:adenylosuccinate lyase
MDTHETDPAVKDAIAEFARRMCTKAAEFRTTHTERKLTISTIEWLWGEGRVISDDILKRLYTELTNTNGEHELIQEKSALNEAGITVRNKGKQERQIQTIHGVLAVRRNVLKAEGRRHRGGGRK